MRHKGRLGRSLFCVCTATSLAACGGSEKVFVGAVSVAPDSTGMVAGIDAGALNIVQTDVGGYVYGLAENVDAMVVGNSGGAASGDSGNFAVSGLLPDRDLGAAYVTGTASYVGRYEMVVVANYTQTPNARAWEVSEYAGPLTATIDFHAADSHLDPDHADDHDHSFDEILIEAASADGRLTFDDVVIYRPQLPALPSTTPGDFRGGVATLDGIDVPLNGQIAFGADGMVAAFNGTGETALVAGGFALDGDGFSIPSAE